MKHCLPVVHPVGGRSIPTGVSARRSSPIWDTFSVAHVLMPLHTKGYAHSDDWQWLHPVHKW